jgi:hypothetical protein
VARDAGAAAAVTPPVPLPRRLGEARRRVARRRRPARRGDQDQHRRRTPRSQAPAPSDPNSIETRDDHGAPSRPKVAAAGSRRKSASAGRHQQCASRRRAAASAARGHGRTTTRSRRSSTALVREARCPPGAARSRAGRSPRRRPDRGQKGKRFGEDDPTGISTVQRPSQPLGPREPSASNANIAGRKRKKPNAAPPRTMQSLAVPTSAGNQLVSCEQHDQERRRGPVVGVTRAPLETNGSETARSPQIRPTRMGPSAYQRCPHTSPANIP